MISGDQKMAEQNKSTNQESPAGQSGQAQAGKIHLLTGLLAVLVVILGIAMAHEVFFLF